MTPQELAAKIPTLTAADIAFPAGPEITKVYDELTPIARQWERDNPDNWGTGFFSKLFFEGGKVPKAKTIEGLSENDILRVLVWVRAAMGSFYPQHENKEAVCGMLWETFFEEPSNE